MRTWNPRQCPGGGEATSDVVSDHLRGVLADVLQADASEFEDNKPFTGLGVDSILAVEIVKKINDGLDTTLRNTDLFNYPNINRLTEHIVTQHEVSAPLRPAAAIPEEPQPQKTTDRVVVPEQAPAPIEGPSSRFWKRRGSGTDRKIQPGHPGARCRRWHVRKISRCRRCGCLLAQSGGRKVLYSTNLPLAGR